jgi:hypothetical protein
VRRDWVNFLAPVQYIPAMSLLAPLDKKTLFKAAVALSKEPEEWILYHDYEPECHVADALSAVLLSHICDKVYIPEGMVDALTALRALDVQHEVAQTIARAKAIRQEEFINAAREFLAAAGLNIEELLEPVPVKRLEENAIRLLYTMGALMYSGMALIPSRQLALISFFK